jgi:hypothetical protein
MHHDHSVLSPRFAGSFCCERWPLICAIVLTSAQKERAAPLRFLELLSIVLASLGGPTAVANSIVARWHV